MIAGSSRLRGIGILAGTAFLGCAYLPAYAPPPPPPPPAAPHLAAGCPYASVYVAVSTNGSDRDTKVARRVRLAYSESLGERGFSVVEAPEEAYWNAFSLVRLSRRVDSTFAWALYMMATEDLRGRNRAPFDFAGEGEGTSELSGFMLLKEVRLLELELQVHRAAEDTASALLPHASRMCVAWSSEPDAELAARWEERRRERARDSDAIERLREELRQEILRVRRKRQERLLHVEVDGGSDS